MIYFSCSLILLGLSALDNLKRQYSPFIMVHGYTFRGSNSVIFSFGSLLKRGLLLKERICSKRSKFFPLSVHPIFHFERAMSVKEENRKSWKLFPLIKMGDKYWGVPIHLMPFIGFINALSDSRVHESLWEFTGPNLNKRALRPWVAHLSKQAKGQTHHLNKPDYWLKVKGWSWPILQKKFMYSFM